MAIVENLDLSDLSMVTVSQWKRQGQNSEGLTPSSAVYPLNNVPSLGGEQ